MSGDLITTYEYKLGLLQDAEKRAKRIIKAIADGARLLEDDWQHVGVSHSPASFPADIVGDHPSIDAREWPDRDELADALANWHEARMRAIKAYLGVPEHRRNSLPPPPLFR